MSETEHFVMIIGNHCSLSACAFTRDFCQGIVDRFRLTERDDGATLDMPYRSFREVLARSTPASIRRLQSNVVTQIPA
jgi:hypothetical protein